MSYNESYVLPRREFSRYGKRYNKLSKGGGVYHHETFDGKRYAVKSISYDGIIEENCIREVAILIRLQHQGIIRIIDVCITSDYFHIILPMAMMSLSDLIDLSWSRGVYLLSDDEMRIKRISYQIINAVDYCHSKGILNLDIKPPNILIFEDDKINICDFGLSCGYLNDYNKMFPEMAYTIWYRAPEIIFDEYFDKKSEYWALGCVLNEIYTGYPLFGCTDTTGMMLLLLQTYGDITNMYPSISTDEWKERGKPRMEILSDFKGHPSIGFAIKSLLNINPRDRPALDFVLSSAYFNDIRKDYPAVNEVKSVVDILKLRERIPKDRSKDLPSAEYIMSIYDWMLGLILNLDVNEGFFFLAQNYMETCLNKRNFKKEELHLLGFVCIIISTGLTLMSSNDIRRLIERLNLPEKEKVIVMYKDMLEILNFDLIQSTSFDFMKEFTVVAGTDDQEIIFLANVLLLLLTIEKDLYFHFKPSDFAASCLYIASVYFDKRPAVPLTSEIKKFTRIFRSMEVYNKTRVYMQFGDNHKIEKIQEMCYNI